MKWINPLELYDTECFLPRGGNMNKLDGSHLERLITLGKEGLLRHVVETQGSMKYQWYAGRRIVNNGCHRAYAAVKLCLEAIPIREEFWSTKVSEGLIHITNWEVLSGEDFAKYLEQLEAAEPVSCSPKH